MDQKYLAEIKARDDRGRPDVMDISALLAEVEDQTSRANICEHDAKTWREDRDRLLADNAAKDQQIATLNRALEIASSEVNKAFETLESHHVITMTQKASGIQENVDTWVHRAQEQEGKK